MELSAYIKRLGVKEFAEKFGVSERAARAWRYRQRTPRREVAERIIADSPVTWAGIYKPTESARA